MDGFKRAQDTDEWSGLMPMIFMHQMERHQSQVNGPGPSAEIHPCFHFGKKKGGSVVHSALALGLVMQRLYILTFAIVCLCMRTCPCVPMCARESARCFPHVFLDPCTHTHIRTILAVSLDVSALHK